MWRPVVVLAILIIQVVECQVSVVHPGDKFCDTSDPSPCSIVTYTGSNFNEAGDIQCFHDVMEIDYNTGDVAIIDSFNDSAIVASNNEVSCPVEDAASQVQLYGSEGPLTDPVTHMVYPMLCMDCTAEGCTFKNTGCMIDGACGPCPPGDANILPEPADEIVLDSCGNVYLSDLTMSSIEEEGQEVGFSLPQGSLSAFTDSLSLEIFARFTLSHKDERVLAEVGNAITIIEAYDHYVIFDLQFTNRETGELVDPVEVKIDITKGRCFIHRLTKAQYRLHQKSIRKWHVHDSNWVEGKMRQKTFGRWLALTFDAEAGEISFFYRGRKLDVDLGFDLTGLYLDTNGDFFISSDTFVCMDISTEFPQLNEKGHKYKWHQSQCKEIIESNKKGRRGCYPK